MVVLKAVSFNLDTDVAKFVNVNNLKREDILQITNAVSGIQHFTYTIFYFADSEAQEINRGFFGW